ncbi:hypothetical protein EJF18_70062 [Clavispora lusitaniae]|uniref:Uncharacterized protein n=1 Tax=Clavispora lusitaniae TaxID=36911 RepID=A0ACD0WS35_CLALS|nr:hypothetical protein E0198_004917 [Clavispora lusitaniae]QFZ30001.1 hypothetical protein EJF14_70062 [Clavispora lusitaniae]QFZ35665.1 hypothetical protein EJF16_70062 [Clavispora lusitaniae]QFZ41347.1 hypothetical protein EJF15_70062 [Clavispora lusitaniae]QFZ47025.1 hypothetical protein EJF18_70062 [Clavispora lusitaniae]
MAASYSDMYPKRKIELEDITNCHKKQKSDKPAYYPTQERSPSPSSPQSVSPAKPRQKSVSFELSRNQHYENSPLLTPKDEDYVSEPEDVAQRNLDSNADYISLCAAQNLLCETKRRIESDLEELSRLGAAARHGSKSDLVDFYMRLICSNDSVPGQHKVVRAPTVDWGKYHHAMSNVSCHDTCNDNEQSLFRTLSLF